MGEIESGWLDRAKPQFWTTKEEDHETNLRGWRGLRGKEMPDLSLHELGLLETLALATQLGAAPGEVVIIGIVPESVRSGLEMSPVVAAAVPGVIDLVMKELT